MTPASAFEEVRLGDVVRRQVETVPSPNVTDFERYVGVDHLSSDDLRLRRWGSVATDELPPTFRYIFRRGAVLFPTRRPALRKCALADFDGITGEKLLVLVSSDPRRLHPSFLPYLVSSPRVKRWAIAKVVGSVTPHFRWSDLAECVVPLPPTSEQARLVQLLDSLHVADEALRCAANAANALRLTLLEDHFSAFASTNISVLDRAQALSGGTPTRSSAQFWDGANPWLSPKDMKMDVVSDTSEHISDAALARGLNLAPPGTTFVVVRGMILQHSFPVCFSTAPMAFNQDVKAFVPGKDLVPEYLALWFRWAAPRLLRMVSDTSHGTKRLESDRIKTLPFSRASKKEQALTVERMREAGIASNHLEQRRSMLNSLHVAVVERMGLS